MNRKLLRLGAMLATAALLLAACGGGANPNPDPEPEPQPRSIRGTLFTAPATGLYGAYVYLCEEGSACESEADVVNSVGPINSGTESIPFSFSDLPEDRYDLLAWMPSGDTEPASQYLDLLTGVMAGTAGNDLQLTLVIQDPTDGSAALSGILYLPGTMGTAALDGTRTLSATASELATITSSSVMPAGDILLGAGNDLGAGRPLEAVPGELVVKFRDDVLFSQASLGTLSVDGVQLQHVQGTPAGQHLYRAAALGVAETIALAEQLRNRPDVERAAPNWILHSFAMPDDPLYPIQWHYDAINMEAAWDIEQGDSAVTVAVVDSGKISHPDLQFTGGYDFISTIAAAGDGNARDGDATDVGDGSGYHGAHVAGTIGATTDNGSGIAGVSWNTTIVPVRVLGKNGDGTMLDILDGITWAAGGTVAGVPANSNPADVINLSLGASTGMSCSEVLGGPDTFFQTLGAETGAIFVVAAGNDNISTSGVFPANCPGVITVGATGPNNVPAPYSNYGPAVDVMAPGGDLTASFSHGGNTYPYGVLSTVLNSAGDPAYTFYQGTSMATPHVAGVIALMLAAEPGLNQATVLARLQSTTSDPVCTAGCGSGLIDAAAALASDGTGTPPPPPPPPAGEAVTYILFSECTDASCGTYTATQYAPFTNVPAGGVRYIISNLQPGVYRVEGWIDLDSGTNLAVSPPVTDIDAGEPYGLYPSPVELQANRTTTGVDLRLTGTF